MLSPKSSSRAQSGSAGSRYQGLILPLVLASALAVAYQHSGLGHPANWTSLPASLSSLSTASSAKFLTPGVASLVSQWAASVLGGARKLPKTYALCSPDGRNIHTVDRQNTKVECIVVDHAFIVDSGDYADVAARWVEAHGGGSLHVRFTPAGSIVVPGMGDSHCHILEYGASKMIPLGQAKSLQETLDLVAQYIIANPDIYKNTSKIVEAWGWDHESWLSEHMPTYADLESHPVLKSRPIILQSKDGHAVWVSKRTLEDNSPIPDHVDGGVIVRDEDGEPTGIFIDTAQYIIARPVLTDQDLERRFDVAVRDALSVGLTSLHDAGYRPASLEFFQKKAMTSGLPIRIYAMRHFDEHAQYWGDRLPQIDTMAPPPTTTNTQDHGEQNKRDRARLGVKSVKMFADGALRTGGAALHEPYTDNLSTRGVMTLSPELLHAVIPRFLKDGWQVNVHAIGDRANGIVLDAFESALNNLDVDVAKLRPRLEHAQIMTVEDTKRLGKLGVIASIQPAHVTDDMWYAEERLGPERIKNLYAFRTILRSGAKVTLGSDFPVAPISPLAGFYAAITRLTVDGRSPHGSKGYFEEQKLSRMEALRGMTIDPAYASFTDSVLGSLEKGKRADLVVLSQDIMTVPVETIMDTKVLATVLDGEIVFGTV